MRTSVREGPLVSIGGHQLEWWPHERWGMHLFHCRPQTLYMPSTPRASRCWAWIGSGVCSGRGGGHYLCRSPPAIFAGGVGSGITIHFFYSFIHSSIYSTFREHLSYSRRGIRHRRSLPVDLFWKLNGPMQVKVFTLFTHCKCSVNLLMKAPNPNSKLHMF